MALPFIREVGQSLATAKSDPSLVGVGIKELHERLSECFLRPIHTRDQIAKALGTSSGATVALQILTTDASPLCVSLDDMAADIARVCSQMTVALTLRQFCESKNRCLGFVAPDRSLSQSHRLVPIEVFEKALGVMPELYLWLDQPFRENPGYCRRLVKANPCVMAFFSDGLLNDAALVQDLVRDCAESAGSLRLPSVLAMLPQRWRECPILSADCVRIWWTILPQMGDALLADRHWVKSLIAPEHEEDPQASASYGSDEIRSRLVALCAESDGEDWSHMQELLGDNINGWPYLPDHLLDRQEAATALLNSDFDPDCVDEEIAALSDRLRADRNLAQAFLEKGAPLRSWDESLWQDPELVALDLLNPDMQRAEICLDRALAGDRRLALKLVAQRPELLAEFTPEVRQDPEVFALALAKSVNVLELATDAQRADMQLMQPAVRYWGIEALRLTGSSLRTRSVGPDAAILFGELLSGEADGEGLCLAADESLRYDPALRNLARDKPEGFVPKEFVSLRSETSFNRERWQELLQQDGSAFFWAPDWVRRDRALTLLATRRCLQQGMLGIRTDGPVIYPTDLCHLELQSDPDLWRAIMSEFLDASRAQQLWSMLMAAPEAVRQDPSILLPLLRVEPGLWKRLTREVRCHPLLVNAMIPLSPELIAREFFDDEEIMHRCCEQNWPVLRFASYRLRSPGSFAQCWLSRHPAAMRFLSYKAKSDLSCVLTMIEGSWELLAQASDCARANPEILQAAMRKHPCALAYAARSLRENREFLMDCLRKGLSLKVSMADRLAEDSTTLIYHPRSRLSHLAESAQFWMEALRELGPSCLWQAPVTLQRHPQLMREGIRLDPSVLEITSPFLKADAEFMLDVLAQYPEAISHLHGSLRLNQRVQARLAAAEHTSPPG